MDAQTIANLITAAMAGATVWLAIETRKMAAATLASVELMEQPHLAFRGTHVEVLDLVNDPNNNVGAVKLGIRLSNPGKVLITYHVDRMTASIDSQTVSNPKFDTAGGVIHPEEELTYFFPRIPTPTKLQPPNHGEIDFQVSFWAAPTERKVLRARVRVEITGLHGAGSWTYAEGPSYA